ncbi:hypothetical protein [Nonomuraea coxensis]|uniref:hypothetical protein n=1 Tax=Nonomuraea coxensis TaxID=404386 RepID=UPI001C5FAB26|nr:hypothetical protein [Nonomuraea coxensis]
MTVVGRVVAAGIVAVGSMVFGGSAHAAVTAGNGASGQITSPSDGQVVSGSSVTVSARTGLMQLRMGLYVDGPSTGSVKVAGGGANQTVSGTFDAGSAPNGTFTVTLKGEITGTRYDSSTFKLRRPAEKPGNVSADLQGTTKVVVTWSKGTEPDLQTYQVSNTQSGVVGRLAADSACSGGSCKAVLAVPAKAAGQKVGFTVRAFRSDGDGGSIGSGESGTAYVSVPAAPAAQPKKEVNKTRTTPKVSERVDPLPTLPARKQTQPSRKATTHRPKATTKVPAIPDTDTKGNLPIPTADGRQEGNDGLTPSGGTGEDRSDRGDGGGEGGADAASVQVNGVKAQSSESVLGGVGQYGLYVAGGLLLLLLGAHAGAWARRRALAAEGGRGGSSQALRAGAPAMAEGASASPASGAVAGAGVSWTGTQARPSGAGGSRGVGGEGAEAGVTLRRRPAVILAVAKTRMPQGSQAADEQASASGGARGGGEPSSLPVGWQRPGAGDGGAASAGGGQVLRQVSAMPGAGVSGAGVSPVGDVAPARGVLPMEEGAAQVVPPTIGRSGVQGVQGDQGSEGVHSHSGGGQGRGGNPNRRGLPYAGGQGREGDAAHLGGHGGRQEPVRIALPSSAVIEVSESTVAAVPRPAVRIEERWDDYLPPSPRSMEDSGFWERPQPGALDFWAPDDDGADGGTVRGTGEVGTVGSGGAGTAGPGGAGAIGPDGVGAVGSGGAGAVGSDGAVRRGGGGAGSDRVDGADGAGAGGSAGGGTSAYAGRRHKGGLS